MTTSAAFLVSLGSDVLACGQAEFQNTKRETMTRQRTETKVLGISGGGFLASSGFGFGLAIETK